LSVKSAKRADQTKQSQHLRPDNLKLTKNEKAISPPR